MLLQALRPIVAQALSHMHECHDASFCTLTGFTDVIVEAQESLERSLSSSHDPFFTLENVEHLNFNFIVDPLGRLL